MPRSVLLRLTDLHEAILGIEDLLADHGYERFARDWGMQRAVERGLEIISEASRHIPPSLKALAPDIPWRQIAAIGNLLRHEYQRVDTRATWNIAQDNLPALRVAAEILLAEARRHEPPA